MKKLKEMDKKKIYHYYPENKKLTKLISDYVKVNSENILIGDGCDGCLEMIDKTFISKNDNILIPIPTFHRYEFHTKLMGGNCIFIEMKDFLFDADLILKEAEESKAKIIFICNPNNPTGSKLIRKKK